MFVYALLSSTCATAQIFIQTGYRNNTVIYPRTHGPGSSVSIATGYGLDGPGIEVGLGGLGVCVLASGTQDRGFAPDRSRRIFHNGKIHSTRLSHVADLRHVKDP
jgi:hypothetical protein